MKRGHIKEIDRWGMIEKLMRFPEMCEEALSFRVEPPKQKISRVVLAGMGGSGIAGDLIRDWLDPSIPMETCKGYLLPNWVDGETLVVATSYSGNTEETLSCFSDAMRRDAALIGITSGGKLEEECNKFGKPLIKIPPGLPPRVALPYLFFSTVVIMKECGIVSRRDEEIRESIKTLRELREKMDPEIENNRAVVVAKKIKDTIPFIYAPPPLYGAAKRFKTQLNENSKIQAKVEFFPELCHNEIVGLGAAPKNVSFVFFRDVEESERMKVRIEFTRKLVGEKKAIELRGEGKGRLSRILSLVYFGDFVSFYLAILRGVDPTPVEEISELKTELTRLPQS